METATKLTGLQKQIHRSGLWEFLLYVNMYLIGILVYMKLFNKNFYKFFFGFLSVISVTLLLIFVIGSQFGS